MGGSVDEQKRHETLIGAHFAIGSDAADMVAVPQGNDRHSELSRLGDAFARRDARSHLAVAALPVVDEDGTGIGDDPAGAVGDKRAVPDLSEVLGDHADPMAVVSLQVGLDKVLRDDPCLVRLAAGGRQDVDPDLLENPRIEVLHRSIFPGVGEGAQPSTSNQKSSTSPMRFSAKRVMIRVPIASRSAARCGSVRSTPRK